MQFHVLIDLILFRAATKNSLVIGHTRFQLFFLETLDFYLN